MGLYVTPSYGFVLQRLLTDEEMSFVEKYENDYADNNKIEIDYDWDNQQLIIRTYQRGNTINIFAYSSFPYDDEFDITAETKNHIKQEFKKLLEIEDIPKSLKEDPNWFESKLLKVTS